MISAKQIKAILDYSFSAGSNFLAPAGSFIATPSSYTSTSLPSSVVLNGSLIPNDATNITWTIKNNIGTTLLAGVGNTCSFTLPSVPTSGSNVYTWEIAYLDTNNNALTLILPTTVFVSTPGLYGQLPTPSDNISVFGDLVPFAGALSEGDQNFFINLFEVVCTHNGRITIVVPNTFGTLQDISDNTDASVLSQFNVVNDVPNNRKIYTTINSVAAGSYYFKLIY